MSLFWNRKKDIEAEHQHELESSIEVVALKKKTHQSAKQATESIEKLNRLLRADGITLKIYIASGGHRGR